METSSTSALKAYADALQRAQGVQGGKSEDVASTAGGGGLNFSDMIKDAVNDVVETSQASEKASMNAVAGGGDTLDVVTAITSAEVTLQTVVTVRDKIIQAYQEIIRMPI